MISIKSGELICPGEWGCLEVGGKQGVGVGVGVGLGVAVGVGLATLGLQ